MEKGKTILDSMHLQLCEKDTLLCPPNTFFYRNFHIKSCQLENNLINIVYHTI